MTTEPARIDCRVTNDSRLLVAAGALAAHAARRAGLPENAQEDFAAAAVEACRRNLAPEQDRGGADLTIRLAVVDFSDRVELMIESHQQAASSRIAQAGAEAVRAALGSTLDDRVQCDAREGVSRVTLIKNCGAASTRQRA